jgi:hypothetical protein
MMKYVSYVLVTVRYKQMYMGTMMTKKPCIECGEQSLVINNEVHFCAPCWIDKFLVSTGDKVDRQPDRKVFGANRKTL